MSAIFVRSTALVIGAFAVVVAMAGFAVPSLMAQTEDVPVLVDTQWVSDHLDDPEVLLVHVAMLEMQPPTAFIPGAVTLDYHQMETSEGLAIELPPVPELVALFEAAGIGNDKHVVLYGGGAAHIAARGFVTLEHLSHPRVSVMDGGIETWQSEGRPTVAAPAAPTPATFVAKIDADMLADKEWIRERLDEPGVALIDARPASQFEGPSNRGLRPGHIPGAGNVYFVEFLESEDTPRLKPRDEAEALFAAAGYTAGDTMVSYCQIGMRASYNYLVARHLGYDVKFYDGSWQEWGGDESLPAETGPRRR